ncbi:MAG: hypothetical protein K6E18_07285 [Lachnospiraceae bacterium]|nr:hypothetical protein [Lachnospiraceae bacterium]
MKLRDLCNELWDDIVALMDFSLISRLYGRCKECSHYEYLKAYLSIDKGFIFKLGRYFNLDMEDRDILMYLPVGVSI